MPKKLVFDGKSFLSFRYEEKSYVDKNLLDELKQERTLLVTWISQIPEAFNAYADAVKLAARKVNKSQPKYIKLKLKKEKTKLTEDEEDDFETLVLVRE